MSLLPAVKYAYMPMQPDQALIKDCSETFPARQSGWRELVAFINDWMCP